MGDKNVLRKEIELHHAIAMAVGTVLGTGIFVSPTGILRHMGSLGASIIMWLFCGLCQLFFALCYAELASRIPLSGGEYIYLKTVFGNLIACARLWTYVVLYVLVQSVFNGLLARYLLRAVFTDCDIPDGLVELVYFIVEWFGLAVNYYSVKLVLRMQVFFTSLKLLLLASIIVLGCRAIFSGDIGQLDAPFSGSTLHPVSYALAFYSGIWSVSGWDCLVTVVGEMKHPKRDLRIALVVAISLATFISILASIAYSCVLSKEEMLASPAVAVAFAQKAMGPTYSWIMSLAIAVAVFGSTIGSDLPCSRVFYMGSKNGHFPQCVSMISLKWKTPNVCLVLMGILSLFGAINKRIIYMLELVGFLALLFQTMVLIAIIILRYKDPKPGDHIVKAPFAVPEISLFIECCLLILTVYERPLTSGVVLLLLSIGVSSLYLTCIKLDVKPKQYYVFKDWLTRYIQKILMCAPEDKG